MPVMQNSRPAETPGLCPGVALGSYELISEVASGGMATVWVALHHGARGTRRLVAIKTIRPDLACPELEELFVREALIASRISHPNVCQVLGLIEERGVLAMAMELVDGDTLATLLSVDQGHAIDYAIASRIVSLVASGLHAMHQLRDESGEPMQLVHRDVSPQNILVSKSGQVKIADFGVAKSFRGSNETTVGASIKGKLRYMSPEQAAGQRLDRRSDVFSLGVVLYIATVGCHPFECQASESGGHQRRLGASYARRPSEVVSEYPAELEEIVLRALARSPDARFASAEEMRRALQRWLWKSRQWVTDQDVAALTERRLGARMSAREFRIQQRMAASAEYRESGVYPIGSSAEATLKLAGDEFATVRMAGTRRCRLEPLGWLVSVLIVALGVLEALWTWHWAMTRRRNNPRMRSRPQRTRRASRLAHEARARPGANEST